MRHRWRPARSRISPYDEIAPERAASLPGAYVPPEQLRGQDEPSLGRHPVPEPLDWQAIIAAPATGTTSTLIGIPSATGTTRNSRAVPVGRRGIITAICPYLEAAGGQVMPPGRIPGAGVTIRWSVLVNGRPYGDLGSFTTILAAWDDPGSVVPIMELRQGDELSVTVTNTDPGALYAWLGVRVRGQFVAWAVDQSVRRVSSLPAARRR